MAEIPGLVTGPLARTITTPDAPRRPGARDRPRQPHTSTHPSPSAIGAMDPGRSDVVRARGGRSAAAGPVGVEELTAGAVDALVGMGAEVVALGLEEVGGESLAAITIVVGQGGV